MGARKRNIYIIFIYLVGGGQVQIKGVPVGPGNLDDAQEFFLGKDFIQEELDFQVNGAGVFIRIIQDDRYGIDRIPG